MPADARVSIITAVYDGARTIGETIASVRAQTEPAWEHLIIDDGSTDATAAVVRAAAEPRTRYHYQPHAGRSAARNCGLDLARGEFVLFLDADDWLLPTALHDHLAFFAAHTDVGVAVSDGAICADDGRTLATFAARRGPSPAQADVLARLIVDDIVGAPLVAMTRSAAIRAYGVRFDPEQMIAEDTLFWIALAQHTRFGFHDAHTCRYRWHVGGTTLASDRGVRIEQHWRARQQILAAPFFNTLPASVREHFFYQVLVQILAERPAEQERLAATPQFTDLPVAARVRLLRLAASEHLRSGRSPETAHRLLGSAAALAPHDLRTRVLGALTRLGPRAVRLALGIRRYGAAPPDDPLTPQIASTNRRGA